MLQGRFQPLDQPFGYQWILKCVRSKVVQPLASLKFPCRTLRISSSSISSSFTLRKCPTERVRMRSLSLSHAAHAEKMLSFFENGIQIEYLLRPNFFNLVKLIHLNDSSPLLEETCDSITCVRLTVIDLSNSKVQIALKADRTKKKEKYCDFSDHLDAH